MNNNGISKIKTHSNILRFPPTGGDVTADESDYSESKGRNEALAEECWVSDAADFGNNAHDNVFSALRESCAQLSDSGTRKNVFQFIGSFVHFNVGKYR